MKKDKHRWENQLKKMQKKTKRNDAGLLKMVA